MVVALIAFGYMWMATHRPRAPEDAKAPPAPQGPGQVVDAAPPPAAPALEPLSPACRGLEGALQAAIQAPEGAKAQVEARQKLEACERLPERACELGVALDARSPLSAGNTPLRGLLEGLCQRCSPGTNPCVWTFSRSLLMLTAGRSPELAEMRWSLEHAGAATPAACGAFARGILVPASVASTELKPAQRPVLAMAAPFCAKLGGVLPAALVHAAAVHQGAQAPELAQLTAAPAATPGPVKPDEVVGPATGREAFDGGEKTGVALSAAATTKRYEADGALRAQFAPPLKQLTTLRVRATGPGTLRAVVRMPDGVGLKDPERGMNFVLPTVCRFKGTGQVESCPLAAPLLDVDAVSVFPDKQLTLHELELLGVR
jgi:hypothetical protein